MTMSPDTGDPAFWRLVAAEKRRLHAKHLYLARAGRRWGWVAEAARFLELAANDRAELAIAIRAERRMTSRRTPFAEEVSP